MLSASEQVVSRFLHELAEQLTIPPSKYNEAVKRYQAVGNWLGTDSSLLHHYRPEVYPQGSFRLGTAVRPVRDGIEADYDVDLVCQLHRQKIVGHERDVKHSVGDRLKGNAVYREMLDKEGQRCWTLNYAEEDDMGFHMDCLPCVPDADSAKQNLVLMDVPWEYAQHAVGITDKQNGGSYKWLGSNPRGYAKWFDKVNKSAFLREVTKQKEVLFEQYKRIYASAEEVPDALVRTPLQRTIQVLKRHRDWRFIGHPLEKEKPISMIITTLTAIAYGGQADIYTALIALLQRIENYQESQIIRKVHGQWYITNPVNPEENFADRWNEPGSGCAEAFFQWLKWLKIDITNAIDNGTVRGVSEALKEGFDRHQLETVSERLQPGRSVVRAAGESVPVLADYSHLQAVAWPVNLRHKVRVRGTVHYGIGQQKVLWQLTNRGLPKEIALRFRGETNVVPPYEVKWQVVNTGIEALAGNDLRGDFYEGSGFCGTTRWESTRYRGTHWIEAFVIKNGICVARSGRTYVRIK
jgi:hypothetical protein